jgi:hypothetical protein
MTDISPELRLKIRLLELTVDLLKVQADIVTCDSAAAMIWLNAKLVMIESHISTLQAYRMAQGFPKREDTLEVGPNVNKE